MSGGGAPMRDWDVTFQWISPADDIVIHLTEIRASDEFQAIAKGMGEMVQRFAAGELETLPGCYQLIVGAVKIYYRPKRDAVAPS